MTTADGLLDRNHRPRLAGTVTDVHMAQNTKHVQEHMPTFHPHLGSILVNSWRRGRTRLPAFCWDFGRFRIVPGRRLSTTDQ